MPDLPKTYPMSYRSNLNSGPEMHENHRFKLQVRTRSFMGQSFVRTAPRAFLRHDSLSRFAAATRIERRLDVSNSSSCFWARNWVSGSAGSTRAVRI